MPLNIEIFIIILAIVIAVVRVILSVMEEKDRANGMAVDPNEYKMSYLVKQVLRDGFTDMWDCIKNLFKKFIGLFKKKDKENKHGKENEDC